MLTTPSLTTPLKKMSFDTFSRTMAPELDKFLTTHKQLLIGKEINKDQALQDMYSLLQGTFQINWKHRPLPVRAKSVMVSSSCITSIITCIVDCVSIVLQAIGIPEAVSRAAGQEIVAEISEQVLVGLERDIKAIEEATTAIGKAEAIFTVFGDIYKVSGIRQILGAIEHSMAWYEWVIMGTVITAQVTAWLATDGVAAAAEVVILSALIAQAVADAVMTVNECNLV